MEIRRATIEDAEFIRSVYGQKGVWDTISDDGSPSVDTIDFGPVIKAAYFLIPNENTAIGAFLFHPWNTITYEMHSAILRQYRGPMAIEAATKAGVWMFDHTSCRKIVTTIPRPNYAAKALAVACGMQQEGIIAKSFLKNGKAHDQYLFGISKEDV